MSEERARWSVIEARGLHRCCYCAAAADLDSIRSELAWYKCLFRVPSAVSHARLASAPRAASEPADFIIRHARLAQSTPAPRSLAQVGWVARCVSPSLGGAERAQQDVRLRCARPAPGICNMVSHRAQLVRRTLAPAWRASAR